MAVSHIAAVGIVAGFVLLATWFSLAVPIGEAPDEVGHFANVLYLRQTRSLPVQKPGELGEAHQPPLYYAIAAAATLPANVTDPSGAFKPNPAFIWANQGGTDVNAGLHGRDEDFPFRGQALAFHLARIASVLLAAGTVTLVIAIGWRTFPGYRSIGIVAGLLVAFNPQFLFISSSVNNDNLLTFASTGGCYQLLGAISAPRRARHWALVGVWVALGLLAKSSAVALALAAALVLVTCAARRRSLGLLLRGGIPMAAIVAMGTGWWFVRNQVLYGDPLGWTLFQQVFAPVMRRQSLQWNDLQEFLSVQSRSFWGVFGWMNVPAPSWFYTAVFALGAACLIGLVVLAARRRFRLVPRDPIAALAVLGLFIVVQEAYLLVAITRFDGSWYQGRYLYPAIGPIMLFAGLGLAGLTPRRAAPWIGGGAAVLLPALGLYLLLDVIAPAYQPLVPEVADPAEVSRANSVNLQFGGDAELVAYQVEPEMVQPGQQTKLVLYWKSLANLDRDLEVALRLRDRFGNIVTEERFLPTPGVTTARWIASEVYVSRRNFGVPANVALGPGSLQVGMDVRQTGDALEAHDSRADSVGPFPTLARLWFGQSSVVDPAQTALQQTRRELLGQKISLLGYDLPSSSMRAGATVDLTLYWQTTARLESSYTVFVQVLNEAGRLVAQQDNEPNGGKYPTSVWTPGQVVRDPYAVRLPADLPPGRHTIVVGMYEWPSLQRLPVTLDGVVQGDAARLVVLSVEP